MRNECYAGRVKLVSCEVISAVTIRPSYCVSVSSLSYISCHTNNPTRSAMQVANFQNSIILPRPNAPCTVRSGTHAPLCPFPLPLMTINILETKTYSRRSCNSPYNNTTVQTIFIFVLLPFPQNKSIVWCIHIHYVVMPTQLL